MEKCRGYIVCQNLLSMYALRFLIFIKLLSEPILLVDITPSSPALTCCKAIAPVVGCTKTISNKVKGCEITANMIPPPGRPTAIITITTPIIINPRPTDTRFLPFPLSLASSFDCSQASVDQLNATAVLSLN